MFVVLLVAIGGGIWSLIHFWDWLQTETVNGMVGNESGSTTVRNIGFVVAGLVALPFAVWRTWVAQRQADTAQQGLLNERYQQGAEMLGSKILSVRLGGIYALERLASEHRHHYHIPTMQLLCAFVRHPPTNDRSESIHATSNAGTHEPRIDVLNAVMSIGSCHARQSRIEAAAAFRLDLRGALLPGADLFQAQLRKANLTDANLSETHLLGAQLASAALIRANLTGACLRNADLSRASLERANLSDARVEGANLAGSRLYHAMLKGAWLSHANLVEAHLSNAQLTGAYLTESDLTRAQLHGSNLTRARLHQADLTDAILSQTNFRATALGGATLLGADLSDANVSGANLGPVVMVIHESNKDPYRRTIRTKITQSQLDDCRADPASPPMLDGAYDAETGEPLVWRGKPLRSRG